MDKTQLTSNFLFKATKIAMLYRLGGITAKCATEMHMRPFGESENKLIIY